MNKKSKTLTLLKEKGIFVAIQYMLLKKFAKLIAPLCFWLNRPLPHSYEFYFITYHATGHNAMTNFLQYCGVSINGNFRESGLQRYVRNYVRLFTYPTHATLALCEYNFKDFAKYTRTLNAKVPALILVRDPISLLKSGVNFVMPIKENIQIIGGGGHNKLFEYLRYGAYNPHTKESYLSQSPCLDKIESYIISRQNQDEFHSWFIFDELLSSVPYITQKHYVDMSEITKDKAFETMKDLSKKFGFEPPKEENRLLFEKQAYANLYHFFPITLNIKIQDSMLHLTFTKGLNRKDIDLTQMLMPLSYQNNPNLESCKVCVKSHKEAQKIHAHLQEIQKEVINTLDTLLQIVETKKAHAFTENDILAYFATHPKIAKDFKAICDKDLQDLKRERPDIIASWQHYQAFESQMLE